MTRLRLEALRDVLGEQPHPLLFATVSGAHLYGFPSRDSDVDLRGAHVLPLDQVIGLRSGADTVSRMWDRDGVEIDLVTHDVGKFCRMLLRPNGYVLEQVLSPLVVATTPAHEELRALAPACLTRNHLHHYQGFARTQWRLFERTGELKPLLYTVRVLLTGIHLMRTGRLEADLVTLAGLVRQAPPYLADLVAAKQVGEHHLLADTGLPLSRQRLGDDVRALLDLLDEVAVGTALPEVPSAEPALHDLLVRLRLGTGAPA